MKAQTILIIVGLLAGILLVSHGSYVVGYRDGYVKALVDAKDIIAEAFSQYGKGYEKNTPTPKTPQKLLPDKEFKFEKQRWDRKPEGDYQNGNGKMGHVVQRSF